MIGTAHRVNDDEILFAEILEGLPVLRPVPERT